MGLVAVTVRDSDHSMTTLAQLELRNVNYGLLAEVQFAT
jgi:hypothetical protein